MKQKKFSNDEDLKKLLDELSAREAVQVRGGNTPSQEGNKGISIGIRINL